MKYYSAEDVAKLLGKSPTTAYRRIATINSKIKKLGDDNLVENGQIPIEIFHQYYPYIPRLQKGVENNNENTTT